MTCPIDHSPSKNLRKYGQGQLLIQIVLAAVGFAFCVIAALTDGYIMNPATYGETVTSVRAEVWSWPIFIASLLYILGILINGNWRWSPLLRMTCAAFHVVTLFLFAFMAYYDGEGFLNPFAPSSATMGFINVWFFALNAGDSARAWRGVK